jgi:hypothetical protein
MFIEKSSSTARVVALKYLHYRIDVGSEIITYINTGYQPPNLAIGTLHILK